MKKSSKIKENTFPIWGIILKTVSKMSLIYTEDLISLNILKILTPLMTVETDAKLSPIFMALRMIPASVAMTTTMSNLFQTSLK